MISVILCGGAGSRLWPVSREQHPKPFILLPDGQSLIGKSFVHAAELSCTSEILTLTNKSLHFKIEEEFKKTQIQLAHSYILEPFGRNTGPAITAAALHIKQHYGEATPILILAADHLISDQNAFQLAVNQAQDLIEEGLLVTFGIKPSGPETGFGYIEADGSKVLRFIEKPDEKAASGFLASGNFFWNAGIFCFKAGSFLSELAHHAPNMLRAVEDCLAASRMRNDDGETVMKLDSKTFAHVPDISIDYSLMEKSDRVAVVPCDIGWNDIGSWTVLCSLEKADPAGNHVLGAHRKVLLEEVSDSDIYSDGRLIAALGVDNLLIVDTPDALLVADKCQVQNVKSIYNKLKAKDDDTYKHHRTVHRPWGSYTLLESGPRFKIKRLEIKPGASISLQLHHHRSEHWIVVSGMAEVTCDDDVFFVDTNESTYIKAGHKHRVANKGLITLVMIEVQSGDYLGEDDIVRFDDIYGRVAACDPTH